VAIPSFLAVAVARSGPEPAPQSTPTFAVKSGSEDSASFAGSSSSRAEYSC